MNKNTSHTGKVTLVGAGPGSPELITVAGYRALLSANIVLADLLLPRDFLDQLGVPVANKLVQLVGDDSSRWTQETICQRLGEYAMAGKDVVRLKGGDPFVFGRGADELDYLADLGIDCEVVPGLSSSIGVPTHSGFPMTQHAYGRSFAVVTARTAGGAILGEFPRCDSLVIMMGVAVLDQIVAKLIDDGWPESTPIAVVQRGTLRWERRIRGTLGSIVDENSRANLGSPATILIGKAAEGVRSHVERPTVLFTGLDPTAFRWLGNLLHWPALEAVPNKEAMARIPAIIADLQNRRFGSVWFTDKLGVDVFLTALRSCELDCRVFHTARIIANNEAVRERLDHHGVFADLTFDPSVSSDPLALFKDNLVTREPADERSVLIIAGTHIPGDLSSRLTSSGIESSFLLLNRLIPHRELGRPLPPHDVIYFISPRGVRAYIEQYGSSAMRADVWCLGRATQEVLSSYAIESKIVPGKSITNRPFSVIDEGSDVS